MNVNDILAPTPTPKIAAIRALTEAGFALMPLNGKTPTVRKWVGVPVGKYGEKELAGVNYGVILGGETFVVDADPRNFKPGDNPLVRLIKDIGGTPLDTFMVKTGGGGIHAYLKKPQGFLICSSLKAYPGIDFKAEGGQVVGPGSIHPDTGKEYVIGRGAPSSIAAATDALLALVKKQPPKDLGANAGTDSYQKDEGSRARFASYLKTDAPTSGSFAVACRGRDIGLPPEMTLELMLAHWNARRAAPRTPEEMKTRVAHAYKYAKGQVGNASAAAAFTPVSPKEEEVISWDTNANGAPKKTFVNLLTYMRLPGSGLHKIFGFNEFTGEVVVVNPAPWHRGRMPANTAVSDSDLILLKKHLAVKNGFEMPVSLIIEAMIATAHDNAFHPVREYLEGLTWDGVARLDTWLAGYCGAADTPYTRACSRKVLCAAVMRIFRPGVKFDHVLVLEGEQGVGKSAVCKILGGEWAGDFKIDPHDKDSIQLMQGAWVIELAELEVTRRSEEDALKAFLTRQEDRARLAFGRLAGKFPRQSIFIASKNPGADGTYLKDATGNRRWWPLELRPVGGQVDFAGLKTARNQLYAEAVVRAKAGEKLFMDTPELKEAARAVVGERHADDPWKERIASWVADLPADRDFLTARDVFIEAMGGVDKQIGRRDTVAIAGIMRTVGWGTGFRRGPNGYLSRGYHRGEAQKREEKDLLEGLL